MNGRTWRQCLGVLAVLLVVLAGCGGGGEALPVNDTLNAVRFVDTQEPPAADAGTVDAGVPPPAPYVRLLQPTGEALVKAHEEATAKADSGVPPLALQVAEGVVGALATIRWETTGVDWVRIDVKGGTILEGEGWRILEGAERLPAAQGAFSFTVPREWATWGAIRYRVEDADAPEKLSDTSAEVVSGGVFCPISLIMVNEVQVPDSAGRGAFVEIVNRYRAALDVGGLRLQQPRRTGSETIHLFPAGFTIPAGVAVVLCADTSQVSPMPTGAVSAVMSGPSVFGQDTGALSLRSPCQSRNQESSITWWNKNTDFFGTGFSSTRWPDMSRFSDAYTQSMSVAGLRSTPGYRADGSPFTTPTGSALPLAVDLPSAPPAFLVSGSASSSVGLTMKARGGTPPYRFSLAPSMPVPTGLTLDSTTGHLRWLGPPAGVTVPVTVRVEDSALVPVRVSKVLTLETVPTPGESGAIILSRSRPPARVGWLYGTQLAGGFGHVWSTQPGVLPGGLALGEDGYLSGQPTTPGSHTFTVRLACPGPSVSCPRGSTMAERVLTLEVLPE
jgi:hypothetical protein